MSKPRILAVALLAGVSLLISSVPANAVPTGSINITTDTTSVLAGDFDLMGNSLNYGDGFGDIFATPVSFQDLPIGIPGQFLFARRIADNLGNIIDVTFGTAVLGTPDDPLFESINGGNQISTFSSQEISGSYNNGSSGLTVNWRFWGLEESTAVVDGHFSGQFRFEVQPNNVPDGGATIAMLGLGMVGLAVARRRKA